MRSRYKLQKSVSNDPLPQAQSFIVIVRTMKQKRVELPFLFLGTFRMDRAVKETHDPGNYSSLPLYIPHRIQSTGALMTVLAPPHRDQYVIGDK